MMTTLLDRNVMATESFLMLMFRYVVSCTYVGLYTTVVPIIHTSAWFNAFFSNQATLNVEWAKRDMSVPKYSWADAVAAIHRCLPLCDLKKTKMVRVRCLRFHKSYLKSTLH